MGLFSNKINTPATINPTHRLDAYVIIHNFKKLGFHTRCAFVEVVRAHLEVGSYYQNPEILKKYYEGQLQDATLNNKLNAILQRLSVTAVMGVNEFTV